MKTSFRLMAASLVLFAMLSCADRVDSNTIQDPGIPSEIEWEPTSMLDSDNAVSTLTLNANGYLIAGIEDGDTYRTKEIGDEWKEIALSFVRVSDLLLLDSSQILAATGGTGLFSSTDNGLSWQQRVNSPITNVSALTQLEDGKVAAAGPRGFFLAANIDDEWIEFNGGLSSGVFFTRLRESNGQLFGGTPQGVYQFNGTGWDETQVNSTVLAMETFSGGLLVSSNAGLFLHNAGGWRSLPSAPNGNSFTALETTDSGLVFAATNSGIFTANTSSFQWQEFGLNDKSVRVLQYQPQRNMLFASVERRVYRLKLD
ncbi:MAG: hypothetical protein ACRBF0_12125 [Calditrichia bacterium]